MSVFLLLIKAQTSEPRIESVSEESSWPWGGFGVLVLPADSLRRAGGLLLNTSSDAQKQALPGKGA